MNTPRRPISKVRS